MRNLGLSAKEMLDLLDRGPDGPLNPKNLLESITYHSKKSAVNAL